MSHPRLAVRINRANANHHLWANHGTWWIHYTLHLPDFTKRRVRQSLATRCIKTARRRRDAVLAVLLDPALQVAFAHSYNSPASQYAQPVFVDEPPSG